MFARFLLFLVTIPFFTKGQEISGTWVGNYEKSLFVTHPEKLVVEIFFENDTLFSGASHLYYKNNLYEHYKIRGYFDKENATIYFIEDSVIAIKVEPFSNTAAGYYIMQLKKYDNTLRFEGKWKDNSKSVFRFPTTGVWLEKKVPDTMITAKSTADGFPPAKTDDRLKRKMDIQSLIEIGESEIESIKIDIYDNGIIDNDTVSVFYNDQLIISKQMISQKPISFTINADKNKLTKLVLVGENLGSIPPCTALMIISTTKKRYEVNLSSDTKSNAAVEFFFKQ